MMGMLRRRNAYREEISDIYEEIREEEDYIEPSYKFFSGNRPIVTRPVELTSQGGGRHSEPRILPKAPTPKRPEPRQLRKVPKVTMFDLQAFEEQVDVDRTENGAGVLFPENTFPETKISASEKERQTGLQEITDSEENWEEDSLEEARQEHIATKELEISQIPIYRNELEQKFGKSRSGMTSTKADGLAKVDDSVKETSAKKSVGKDNVFAFPASAFAEFEGTAQEYSRETVDRENANEEIRDGQILSDTEEGMTDRDKPVQRELSLAERLSGAVGDSIDEEKIIPEKTEQTQYYNEGLVHSDIEESAEPLKPATSAAEQEAEVLQFVPHAVEEVPEPLTSREAFVTKEEPESFQSMDTFSADVVEEPLKPMASFAPKEEVIDVTPSGTSGQMGSEPLSEVRAGENASHKNTNTKAGNVSHGKIGGEDYVSASDTFNALNESKVSKEPDKPYEFPPIDLLGLPQKVAGSMSDDELRATAMKLQETLESFNVHVKMGAVTCGPTVTRYELLPEQGVRVNKITNLADDLKLSLAAKSIRIEAPIPGKAAVGIEVPNPTASAVFFRELLEGDTFQKSKSPMTFAVGKDIGGKIIMADISKMPHLLIAGATGSGKSVCINTLIMSILYKSDPKDVKLIMIDPKVVELSVYNGIPHLFCPVVTDPKEAAAALNWAVREMMDRYNKFKELGVRNISGYNDKIQSVPDAEGAGYAKMPYLVVIVDEFADLMMVASKEVEDAVCRLAQLARAAGIHLVLATQRPSVNVITGVIKANIPSRIAFSVSSVTDSRTILDKGGAEKLLGKGDMLFFPSGYSEPVRVQGAFVTDNEVSDVVEFLRQNNDSPEYNNEVTEVVDEPKEVQAPEEKKSGSEYDEYFADAGRFVIESDRAAAGQLQRKFSIGFNRAGRIIDQLHKAGVVGPAEGTKPRKVLMTIEEFDRMVNGDTATPEEEQAMLSQGMEEAVVTVEEQEYF